MECKDTRQLMDEAIDGRLPPARASEYAAHLSVCAGCSEEERRLRRVGDMLRLLAESRARENSARLDAMWTRVHATIGERGRERGAPAWLRRWFWLPAAAVLAVLTLLFYPSDVSRAPFHPRSFEVSVESLESDAATVAFVDRGDDLPRVIWIIEEDGKT